MGAFVIALLVVPTTYQLRLPLAPGVPAYSQEQVLYAAGPLQQAVPIQGSLQVPYTTLADALDQYNSYAQGQQAHYVPVIALQSASVNAGENITFVVRDPANLTKAQMGSLNLYVFMVDPAGAVAATFPYNAGMSMGTGGGGAIVYSFSANGVAYAPNTYTPEGFRFTWRTTSGDQSVGMWRVYAFMNVGVGGGPWVAGESSVEVGQPGGSLGFIPGVLASAALFFGVYQAEGSIFASVRKHRDARRWLRNNALWFVAAAFLIAFLMLGYFG